MSYLIELPDLPICITERGEWLHGTEPLHPRAAKLFEKHIEVGSDGAYFLRLGLNVAKLHVADTAFFVRGMALYRENDGSSLRRVDLVISDDVQEILDPRTLMYSADNVLYCRVLRSGFSVPCRFLPYHYHALALNAEMDAQGGFLTIGGERYRFGPYDPMPYGSSPAVSCTAEAG